jgi:hypothetical protein
LDKRKTDENNKKINEGAEDLIKGGATAQSVASSAGTTFGSSTDKPGKINEAKQARAYMKMDFTERKDFVDADVRGRTASAGTQNVINMSAASLGIVGPAATAHALEQAAVSAIALVGAANDAEVARVNRFMNSQMATVVRKGSNT